MESLKSIFHDLIALGVFVIAWITKVVGQLGYLGIVILMGLESSFIPFPSEVVIPPAGYLASKGEYNIFIVILAGVVGSILGSLLNYWIADRFGRSFLLKHSKFFFINEEKFNKFEVFFRTHGEITTFVGRLIPVIRQYISFPAGLVKMDLLRFTIYTGLGALIWCTILAYVGYFVGNNSEFIKENLDTIMIYLLPCLILLVFIYIIVYKVRKNRKNTQI